MKSDGKTDSAVLHQFQLLVFQIWDKETNERTDGRMDGRRDSSLRPSIRPSVRSFVSLSVASVKGVHPMGETNRDAS